VGEWCILIKVSWGAKQLAIPLEAAAVAAAAAAAAAEEEEEEE
jgi:hypothetical protein